MYSCRTVPPHLHSGVLATFETDLRTSLEELIGEAIPDRSWVLAQLSLKHGGLGVRDPVRHAPAAYLGSLGQTQALCRRIDPEFDVQDGCGGLSKAATEDALRNRVLDAASWDWGAVSPTQKELSAMVDGALHQELQRDQAHDRFFCAHLALASLPGAGAFLTAPPVDDGREFDTPLFQVSIKRRLRAPVFETEHQCPVCGEVMDRWGDHALTCSCGGDRTVRHNAIRNIFHEEATEAGLRPEREGRFASPAPFAPPAS